MEKLYMKRLQHTIALTLSIAGGLYHMAWAAPPDATALPTGEDKLENATVTRDTTTSPTKPVMTIEQTKGQSKAFISWDTFNIGKDATVNVKQYSGADLLVNAVRGSDMSEIAGKLNATGNVALINPNGVIFMDGAQVNVGGLGVYATGYDASKGIINNSGNEGSIEIQSGAVINVGVSAVLKNLSALNMDPKDYAIAIDSTGESGYTNRIHLVAEGNVDIQGGTAANPTKITAKDYTYVGTKASVGEEGFKTNVSAAGMGGKIYIRSDRDADDYGSVIITHGENSKAVMQSANGVSIYTNAEQVDGDTTKPGINAAVSRTESGDDATTTYYTKHDYKNMPSFDIDGTAYTDGTSVSVEGPGTTADKLSSSGADNKIATSYAGNGATTITTSLLVNNIDQLQDIEDGTYGNLDGRYVLGRDINATDDEHSYIDDGILYKMTDDKDGNPTMTKWSTKDGVAITGTKSRGDLSKTVNGTTIGYSKDENKATTTLTDGNGTTLSNSNGTVGAENAQWSTTKGVSTVTDKTAGTGSTYTIQSDKKSVVDQDGRTSNTAAKTVTDKDNTYTVNIGENTVTHASDNSVTNTNSKTVTKAAGTLDAGYTATITDGTDTAAGTSGTIAIKDITYQVTDGKVGDTVTYGGSSVNAGKNTVTTGGVTTAVTENGTGTDGIKEGTIASDTVKVDGTTTTVNDGTTSYQITTGTDAVNYTKGTTSASISGTNVTISGVSADTRARKVVKGDTTAVITGDTAGTVTYSGQDYAVADGAVSMTDSKTRETVTVTGEDATKVLNIFSAAKTALSNAQSIYSDAAKAQSLTTTLDAAIETLQAVKDNVTEDTAVQSTFQSAAAQLQSDTALFGTASTALSNATTALTQYNALQKEISNNTKLEPVLKQAYDEFQSTRLDDTTISNIHSNKWDGGKGFNPLGSSDAPFTGTLDGFSGETVFGLYNLTINRPDEDNVGLISVAGASGNAASFNNIHLYSAAITGNKNVGTVAGTLQQGSSLSWSGSAGTVSGTGESLGGLVGLVDGSSVWDSSSSATVAGGNKAGGIAGTLRNGGTLTDVRNFGDVSGTEDVGGIAGYVEGGTITGSGSAIYNYANTYNTGTVTGTTDTGGIVGHAKGIYMYGVFNTNEDAPLSKKSQLIIDDSNKVIQRGDGTTSEKGTAITAASLKSSYGNVTGGTNTGGLLGFLEDAPGYSKKVKNINISSKTETNADGTTTKDAVETTIHNNVIDTSYNAGNITGTGDNTGGLVGQMTGGTLSNVYNADNNTVLREQGTIPDAVKKASITDTSDHSKIYAYNSTAKVSDGDQDLTQYYSFFTVDDSGSRTYYYFLPVKTTSGTTQKGAGGIYVTADGKAATSLPSTSKRYYFNRTFNKDANVKGTGKNTGGLVGSMTTASDETPVTYQSGSVIDSAYNAGTITGSDTTTTGALVGYKDDASLLNDSFYVTGTDAANGNTYSNVSQAVGASSAQDKNIENTAGLDATGSKKKYYVSDDSKRGSFPGVQQKPYPDKDSSGNITTYYEYTSGTNGSFYTDGTGSIDSIRNIYPITTTGTTDPSTGKTTYTSTRSTTAAYTKTDGNHFKDASGNTYTASYDTATRQIVLTPVSSSTSTAATVVLNAVLAARTANETWTIYEDQTRPLLTAFLNTASLSRTFNYDGTTHNLKTDDVANLYGRADFDGDAGKDVQLSNYQLSSNGVSSEYTYDNTSIWSPQHGYFMDPESTLVINPVNMSANIYGTRVYGDIFNTRGYYVCVPYKEGSDQKYSFYQPAEDGSDSYTLLEGDALQKLFGTETPSEKSLLEIAEQKGRYVLELNGFINGEGVNDLGSLIKGLVQTLSKSGSTSGSTSGTTRGNDLQHLFSNVTADTYLDAGIYNVTDAQITGLTATNQNYTINYGGTLTVKQAELYYTYDGSRTYGLQNTDPSATHTYTLVGVDSDTPDSANKYTSTHGFLKYWDLDSPTITIKNDEGTETTIDNPYKTFFKENGNSYEINQDNIGVTGYTAKKTTTTTDVTTGTSTTVTSKDDTKSASLDDIYANMMGTVNTDSINKPGENSTTKFKVIGSYGDGAVSNDMYTHVLVDKDGNPIGYKVTSFASTNKGAKDAGSTIQLYFKTSSDTTNAADKNIQAAVDKFNQNYKLVWKEGGTYDKKYTIGDPTNPNGTPSEDAGIKTATGGLTINDSTFTILPKTATVTITGHRAYGDTMNTSSYSTSTGTAASGQDTKVNQYNVNIDGLTNGDSVSILDPAKTETLLSGIDKTTGTAADAKAKTVINKYTDVVRDNNQAVYQDISGFTNSNVSVVNGDASTDKMNVTSTTTTDGTTSTTTYDKPVSILTSNNYDYILQDGTHQLKITPVDIHVKVSGSKTYGDFTSQAATDYTASVSGGKTYDGQKTGKVTLKTDEVADIVIDNNLDERSNAGTYTYDSSKSTDGSKAFTISLADDTANTDKNDYNPDNYNISFDTTYDISQAELWYTYEGTRAYGADNTTTTNTFKLVGVDTANSNERVRGFLKYWDVDTANGNTIALTPGGDEASKLYAMSGMADDAANKKDTTIRSITGGNNSDTYSHVIVDKDGMVVGYNLSSLGLSADANLSLTDTAKNAAFKNNYKLVWKPQVQTGTDGKGTIQSKQTTTASVKDAATDAVSINRARTVDVGASTLTINPVNLTVEVTGKRQYGHTMTDSYQTSIGKARVTANGVNVSRDKDNPDTFLENGTYNLNLNGLVANDDESVLNTERVKEKLEEVEGDGKDPTKINKYTAVNQGTTDNLATKLTYNNDTVHAFDITKRDDNTENKNSQITVTDTTNGHYNLLNDGNYDYKLVDGTHTLTIDRQDLNLDIKAERQYGDISNQRVVSDYKNNAIASGTTSSYATGITVDGENGLQNGETIDFTNSTVALSDNFAQADAGTYTHNWYNDDTNQSVDYSIGNKGITSITLKAGEGSAFDPKNYNIHYTTTYTIDKADLYYTYDGERHYGEDNAVAAHTYTIVGKDDESSKESVRGYLKSWDSGVLSGGNVLNKDLLTVTNEGSGAYTMTGMAIQDADTAPKDYAANVTDPKTSKSIGKDSGYSHVIVDKDGKILSYTLDTFGTKLAGKDASGTLAKNYKLVWKQGGNSNKLDKVYTTAATNQIDGNGALQATTDTVNKITVNNSSFKINPLALTVTVTGQRDYGNTMDAKYYTTTTDGTIETGKYNLKVTGDFANGETADSVLDEDNVKKMLASLENDETQGDGAATRENSNGKDGQISRYTDVKRKEADKSQIDSYRLNVGSADTSSTITLASEVQTDASGNITSIKHANQADSSHGFNVLNDDNYDYVVSEGSHTLTINPVNLTVNVKGESTYGKADTTYTVTSTGAKNGETIVAGSETRSNLAANAAAGSYTADAWTDTTGAATSTTAASGKYLNTAALRAGQSSDNGTATDKGIYQVQLAAGENTDGSGLSTFSANNYNITYQTTQVVHPEKLTIAIGGTKVYGSQPTGLTAGSMKITSGELAHGDSLNGLTVADNMGQPTDAGTYRHNWSIYAGGSVSAESYTYTDADGQTHTGDSTATSWITGVTTDSTAFDFNNYDVDFQSTYEVTKRPLQLDVTSTSVYGDTGYTYTAQALTPEGGVEEGLVSGQQFNPTDIVVTDDIDKNTDAGTYTHTSDGTSYSDADKQPKETTYKGITAVAADSLKDAGHTGFKSSNYAITLHQGTHTIEKRTVRATVSGSQVYGESAPTSGEAYQVAFDMAGGTGVNAHEGLVGGQTIDNSQVTVNNSVGVTNDVGTYTTTQSDVGAPIAYGNNPERVDDKDQGIDGLVVSDGTGTNAFKNNNYNIVLEKGSYTVTKRPVTFLTTGSRTYGEGNDTVKDYTIEQMNTADHEGLTGLNAGTVTADKTAVINKTEALTDADSYGTESDSAEQVLDIDDSVQKILGDDYKNYAITYQDAFTINPRTVRVTIAGESTYGDAARTAGTDYKTIDFERAGADGVAAQEGLVGGQTIAKSQVTVQTDGLGEKTDAGTYHLSTGDGQPGINGITVKDDKGFKNNNYRIVMDDDSTYTIDKRPLTITIKGEKTYGDPTSFSGGDYTVSQSGLQNNETIDFHDARVLHSADTSDRFSNAGEYRSSENKGILGFDDSTLHGEGFKLGNYDITYDTFFVIDRRPVDVYMESRRTSGSPSSLRMDEPMQMRNVPQEHQARFLSDLQVIDTAPQVIAAGDYPGDYLDKHGAGYLDLSFAGDIYRNYMIHRHTVYHILPDRMMKPGVYNAVQPVRRPILDVMYLKVDGSEGINRWGGAETPENDGAIILKDNGIAGSSRDNADRTSQANQSQPNPSEHLDQPARPVTADGMGELHEEVEQAVPVVYTDGENKELGGRYHLAYENDTVVVRPTADAADVPALRTASAAEEARKVLRVPYQGAEGEYEVAYADGIVQLYPKNGAARHLAEARGKDEQRLLQSGLDSAMRELGVQLEDVEAVYIFTK